MLAVLAFSLVHQGKSQNTHDGISKNNSKIRFIEGELMAGSIVPNLRSYPSIGILAGAAITIGNVDTATNSLNQYFNYPRKGLYFSFHHLGNDSIFGKQISMMPVIELKAGMKWSFRIGLGASYYTKTYSDNSQNVAIGSNLTWGFQAYLYRYIPINDQSFLKIGAGFLHGSNGHLQLPNFGLNSGVLTVGWQYFNKPLHLPDRNKIQYKEERVWMLSQRVGVGWHELGGTEGPVGGPKKPVYGYAIAAGVLFKKHFKLQAGFGYRYYQQFANYIAANPDLGFTRSDAQNVYFTLGAEFFINHISMVVEGGLNLYKPFYPYFAEKWEGTSDWSYQLKRFFLSRVGMNFYLLNTSKLPKHNVYLGAQLNANFGEADFSGISLGYLLSLSK